MPTIENHLLPEDELITTLKEILAEDELSHIIRPYYAGGTLCLDYKHPSSNLTAVALLNFSDDRLSSEAKYLMAKIYIKHKTEKHAHWDEANRIVEEWNS